MVSCLHVMPSMLEPSGAHYTDKLQGKKHMPHASNSKNSKFKNNPNATCFKFQKFTKNHSKCHMFQIPKFHKKSFQMPHVSNSKHLPKAAPVTGQRAPPSQICCGRCEQTIDMTWKQKMTENDMQMKCKQK